MPTSPSLPSARVARVARRAAGCAVSARSVEARVLATFLFSAVLVPINTARATTALYVQHLNGSPRCEFPRAIDLRAIGLTLPSSFDRLRATAVRPRQRRSALEPCTRHRRGPPAGRAYAPNFADLHPRLSPREARVAAERCLFCYDAPCVQACPTSIDIPLFIRQIATGNPLGSAKTILDSNIMGGMCARVCPTETLCEEVCVREIAEGKPVEIGRLQRYRHRCAVSQPAASSTARAPPTGTRWPWSAPAPPASPAPTSSPRLAMR